MDAYSESIMHTLSTVSIGDWLYEQKRNCQTITPGLIVGPYEFARKKNLEAMQQRGVTHVICVRSHDESPWVRVNHEGVFEYLVLTMEDRTTENIIQLLIQAADFARHAVEQCNGVCYVHDLTGISRGPTVAIACTMALLSIPFKEAMYMATRARFCISPNEGFLSQLREFESIYAARLLSSNIDRGHGATRPKRRSDDMDQDNDDNDNNEDSNGYGNEGGGGGGGDASIGVEQEAYAWGGGGKRFAVEATAAHDDPAASMTMLH